MSLHEYYMICQVKLNPDPNMTLCVTIAPLSVDKMYVIKTMTTEEIEEMHHLLKQVSRPQLFKYHGHACLL